MLCGELDAGPVRLRAHDVLQLGALGFGECQGMSSVADAAAVIIAVV